MSARRLLPVILITWLALSAFQRSANAKIGHRSVSYSYFQAECFMWVVVAEGPSGPQGEVFLTGIYGEQPRRKPFHISQAEFDEIWSTLNAPGVVTRPIRRDGKNANLGDCYIFEDGEQKFAVPIYGDSPAISRLATRLKGYGQSARDGMMYLIPWTEVTGGELADFGIYEMKSGGGVQLLQQTDVIPARPNTNFGIRYRIKGQPKGRETHIRVEVKHPKPGGGSSVEKSEVVIGIESLDYRGVKLTGRSLLPGRWEIQIFWGSQSLVKKAFAVTASN